MHFVSTRPLNEAIGVNSGGQAQAAGGVGESSPGAVSRAVHEAQKLDDNHHVAPPAITLIHEGPKQVLQLRLGTPACPWAGRPRANVIAARLFAALLWPVARLLRKHNHGHRPLSFPWEVCTSPFGPGAFQRRFGLLQWNGHLV